MHSTIITNTAYLKISDVSLKKCYFLLEPSNPDRLQFLLFISYEKEPNSL